MASLVWSSLVVVMMRMVVRTTWRRPIMWPGGPLQVEWKSSPWRDMGGHCRAGMGLGEALKLPERGALGMPLERRHWPLCGLFSEASPTCW